MNEKISSAEKVDKTNACKNCLRPSYQCICNKVKTLDNSTYILLLQHPQEQYKLLNSAKLSQLCLTNSSLKVGLSWRNLAQAIEKEIDKKQWAVLYLRGIIDPTRKIEIFDTKKCLMPLKTKFQGIIVLDGSWKQSKAIWWRNPWLLKLNRITLNPEHESLRGQSKKEGLSTIEAIAMAFDCLGENAEIGEGLRKQYEELIIKPNT